MKDCPCGFRSMQLNPMEKIIRFLMGAVTIVIALRTTYWIAYNILYTPVGLTVLGTVLLVSGLVARSKQA